MGRMRGDETYRLLLEAAERAARRGDGSGAAAAMGARGRGRHPDGGGSAGRSSEDELRALLAPRGDARPRARRRPCARHLILDQALDHVALRPPRGDGGDGGRGARARAPSRRRAAALERARRGSGSGLGRGSLSTRRSALSRERVELLAAAPDRTRLVAFERSDAFNMLTEASSARDSSGEALRWDEADDGRDRGHGPPHRAARVSVALHARRVGRGARARCRVRESWLAEAVRRSRPFSPALACVAAIHGLRGDGPPSGTGSSSRPRSAPTIESRSRACGCGEADAALHRGELARAIELLEPPRADRRTPTPLAGEDLILAKRAEALILAGDPSAAPRRSSSPTPGRPTTGSRRNRCAARRGVLESDEARCSARRWRPVRPSSSTRPESGAHRVAAAAASTGSKPRRAFERLGAVRAGLAPGAARRRAGAGPASRAAARPASACDSTSGRNAHAVIPWAARSRSRPRSPSAGRCRSAPSRRSSRRRRACGSPRRRG